MKNIVYKVLEKYPGVKEGSLWPQGDHSIFVQFGRPAVAVSSEWFINNMDSQDITHIPKDSVDIVDIRKVIEIADALHYFCVSYK
jgi:aminopeptidase YwaD